MSDNVLDTRGDYRVILERDTDAEAPYDDGGFPVIQLPHSPGYRGNVVAQLTELTSYVLPAALVEAAAKWRQEPDTFERFARIFYGVTSFAWADDIDRDASFVALNPADWREALGVDEDNPAHLDELRAFMEGDVWGYVIEKRETWTRERDGEEREEWEMVDSCFGFYGRKYAEQAAQEAFDGHPDVPAAD